MLRRCYWRCSCRRCRGEEPNVTIDPYCGWDKREDTVTEETRVQIFIAMNEAGDWEVDTTADEASERLINSHGAAMIRVAVIDVNMDGGEVDIPDEAGETAKVEASSG